MKLTKLLLLGVMATSLASCGLIGGDEGGDATLYKLTLSYSDNVANKEGFTQDKLTATLAFGENRVPERSQEEIEDLKNAGASDADIEKAGTRQSDGTYYFFDQDPMYINTPDVEGYFLTGIFYKGTNNLAYRPGYSIDFDGVERQRRWNMDDENVELEARYQVLEYDITYVYSFDYSGGPTGTMQEGSHSNPTKFNYEENKNVTLTAPTATFEGLAFDCWMYRDANNNFVPLTELPKAYSEEVFRPTVTQTGIEDLELVVWAHYDYASYKATFTFEEPFKAQYLQVKVLDESYTPHDVTNFDEPIELKSNYSLDIWVQTGDVDPAYEFEGIYINGVKIPGLDIGGGLTRPNNHPSPFQISEDTTIEIKFVPVA